MYNIFLKVRLLDLLQFYTLRCPKNVLRKNKIFTLNIVFFNFVSKLTNLQLFYNHLTTCIRCIRNLNITVILYFNLKTKSKV